MENEKRRLLIIRASQDVCGQEVELVRSHAEMLGLQVVQQVVDRPDQMKAALSGKGSFEYFYLCSHGSRDGFEVGRDSMSWEEFATMVCNSSCLTEESTFLMACCRGGLNRVAYDMLIACPSIDYICGPSTAAMPTDLTTAFVVFLTQIETKGADQTFAAEKASQAIDRQFLCFDRNIVEGQQDYHLRKMELDQYWAQKERDQIRGQIEGAVKTVRRPATV